VNYIKAVQSRAAVVACRVLLVRRNNPEAEPIKFDLPSSVAFLHIANAWEVGDWVHVALCRYGNECAPLT
jgi:carotenoid cleavage dioxygenase-like enzyme